MSTLLTPAQSTSSTFQDGINDIVRLCTHLSRCKAEDNFPAFQEALAATGINGKIDGTPSDHFFWSRMNCKQPAAPTQDQIMQVKKTCDLPNVLGVELDNHDVPRAAMLYYIMNTMMSDLLEIHFTLGSHVGGTEGRRNDAHRVHMKDVRTQSHPNHRVVRLFQGHEPTDLISNRVKARSKPLIEALGEDDGQLFGKLIHEQKMEYPAPKIARLLAPVLNRARSGEKIVVAGACCPDYSYEETGIPDQPYRYTFDQVGDGIGLVAQQFVRVMPPLYQLLLELGLTSEQIEFYLGIGDFEANSQDTLDRVGLTKSQFHDQCSGSLLKIPSALPDGFPVQLEMYECDRAQQRLETYKAEALDMFLRGDFGLMGNVYSNPKQMVETIANDGATFYRRWYGDSLRMEDVIRRVLEQGSEYAAMARIDREDFGENLIILSGDRPNMHAFDQTFVNVPVLAVKRAY